MKCVSGNLKMWSAVLFKSEFTLVYIIV
jgi:hypothetical protein